MAGEVVYIERRHAQGLPIRLVKLLKLCALENDREKARRVILSFPLDAREQYLALNFFYKLWKGITLKGAYNTRGFLSREEQVEIIRLREQGKSIREIARALARPPSTVHAFLRRTL